ncbi:MAG: signal peptidase I [Clostridia bacterium]|nr:signal peptidase I [Oscillospiraceae bacterium]MBQ6796965.1 signal peptidase I [Clostridia bacterium]
MNNATMNRDEKRKLTGFAAEVYEWLESIAFAFAIAVILFTFVFRIVSVSGPSMNPTLNDADRLVVSCLFYEPEYNDVVIIAGLGNEDGELYNEPLVKRVIATEGQTVQIVDDIVYVDGKAIKDSFGATPNFLGDPSNYVDLSTPTTVPEECVFVLGDNRMVSRDSRHRTVGFVPETYILGKVILRMYPFDSFGTVE